MGEDGQPGHEVALEGRELSGEVVEEGREARSKALVRRGSLEVEVWERVGVAAEEGAPVAPGEGQGERVSAVALGGAPQSSSIAAQAPSLEEPRGVVRAEGLEADRLQATPLPGLEVGYLNEGCLGGETEFASGISVEPRTGMALAFVHQVEHRGAPVFDGIKYVLRTDVMYAAP